VSNTKSDVPDTIQILRSLSWVASILIFLVVLPFSSGQSLVQRFLGHEAVRSGTVTGSPFLFISYFQIKPCHLFLIFVAFALFSMFWHENTCTLHRLALEHGFFNSLSVKTIVRLESKKVDVVSVSDFRGLGPNVGHRGYLKKGRNDLN
jgi:hypothetical protein